MSPEYRPPIYTKYAREAAQYERLECREGFCNLHDYRALYPWCLNGEKSPRRLESEGRPFDTYREWDSQSDVSRLEDENARLHERLGEVYARLRRLENAISQQRQGRATPSTQSPPRNGRQPSTDKESPKSALDE